MSAAELGKNPGPLVIVPAMTLAYLAMLIAMYGLVTRHRQRPFWQTVGWRWPGNLGWLGFMVGGALLAVVLGELVAAVADSQVAAHGQVFPEPAGRVSDDDFRSGHRAPGRGNAFSRISVPGARPVAADAVHDAASASPGLHLGPDHGRLGIS